MPAEDLWNYGSVSREAPASNAAQVTPSDSVDLTYVSRAVFIGAAGTLSVEMHGGGTVSFDAYAGMILPIRATRVNATGTTATGIVALW